MILLTAWVMLALEFIVALVFGVIFWRVWSRSAMSSTAATVAIVVYCAGSVGCLLLTFFVPL